MAPELSSGVSAQADTRPVLVCGLGRLGRHCVETLAAFGVPLRVVDTQPQGAAGSLPPLDRFCLGDCRNPEVLKSVGVEDCRTIIVATGAERVNVAAAVTVRAHNPDARIVIRSGQSNLNRLLGEHLGDFVALEPTALAAPAFALAGLGDDTLGLLRLDSETVRVRRVAIREGHGWLGRPLHELNTSYRRVVARRSPDGALSRADDLDAEGLIEPGDLLTFVEVGNHPATSEGSQEGMPTLAPQAVARGVWRKALTERWRTAPRVARVALGAAAINVTVYLACALLYRWHYRDLGTQDALNVAMVLILGGYDNLFGQLRVPFPIPYWLNAVSVLASVCGTVGVGIVYAFITERVLSARFSLFRPRRPMPRANHCVVVGDGPLASAVAKYLVELGQPAVLIASAEDEVNAAAGVLLLTGEAQPLLARANVRAARSVIAIGEDDVANLEAALAVRATSSRPLLVVRSDDARFRESVVRLTTGMRAFGLLTLAAEAFAASAMGENVHGMLHVGDRTLLVIEFEIDDDDGMAGRLMGDIAYGYGVVPIMLRRGGGRGGEFLPPDDVRLRRGDGLVLLSSVEGLRAIERGEPRPAGHRVEVMVGASPQAVFDAALVLSRVTGCELASAKEALTELPAVLPMALHRQPAQRVVRELAKVRVTARLV